MSNLLASASRPPCLLSPERPSVTQVSKMAQISQMDRTATSHKPRNLIVDSQVHIWLAESPDRPWPPGGVARANLPEPFTYNRLLPLMDDAGVDRVIIVPPFFEGERNDYALEAAKKYPDRFAVMGRILLSSPQAPSLLPRWKDQTGMLGIRLTFNWVQ